jgi:hypothetical protein
MTGNMAISAGKKTEENILCPRSRSLPYHVYQDNDKYYESAEAAEKLLNGDNSLQNYQGLQEDSSHEFTSLKK